MKKIIFPFFNNERHNFLLKKWWFRLITVIYIIAFIAAVFLLFSFFIGPATRCYDSMYLFYSDPNFNKYLASCSAMARSMWLPGIGYAVVGTLILHYLIQIIFFKIIINYIVLGGKK